MDQLSKATTRARTFQGSQRKFTVIRGLLDFNPGCLPGPARRWSLRGPHQWVLAGQSHAQALQADEFVLDIGYIDAEMGVALIEGL